jgi:hypothetical protein
MTHTKDEALKLALKALENFADVIKYDNEQDDIGYRACCYVLSYDQHSEECKATKAIAAIKQVLAAQPAVQEGRDWSLLEATQESLREHMAEIKRLKAEQPAPVQEPFGWYYMEHGEIRDVEWTRQKPTYEGNWKPLYTTPPAPQPVPVKTYSGGKPWPVAPKPWVNLTDEEILKVYDAVESAKDLPWFLRFARAIETKLKEKNHDQ